MPKPIAEPLVITELVVAPGRQAHVLDSRAMCCEAARMRITARSKVIGVAIDVGRWGEVDAITSRDGRAYVPWGHVCRNCLASLWRRLG